MAVIHHVPNFFAQGWKEKNLFRKEITSMVLLYIMHPDISPISWCVVQDLRYQCSCSIKSNTFPKKRIFPSS